MNIKLYDFLFKSREHFNEAVSLYNDYCTPTEEVDDFIQKNLKEEYVDLFIFGRLLNKDKYKDAVLLYKEEYLEHYTNPEELKKLLLPYLL